MSITIQEKIEATIKKIDKQNTTGEWLNYGRAEGLLLALKLIDPDYKFKDERDEENVQRVIKEEGLEELVGLK